MRKEFYDARGKLVGYTLVENESVGRRIACYSANGVYVGYTDDSGTYDHTGRRLVSMDRVPGLLFRSAEDDEDYL